MIPYQPPVYQKDAFNCPHCRAYSAQEWGEAVAKVLNAGRSYGAGGNFATCSHCGKSSFWVQGRMVFPAASTAPMPNADLPPDVKADYDEASAIVGRSARGAAALLRLGIQKLCVHLGEPGKDLNGDIANLVRKGLSTKIQQALDVVRVIGNEAVHPGTIDLRDDPELALKLFALVNIIADAMITQPLTVSKLFDSLPEPKKDGVRNRDGSVAKP
jgi:hypothetical protein